MVLLVDKPRDWTSFDVVAKLRGSIRKKINKKKYKIGHAGTLDPLATGLLIICTGRLTKTISEYQELSKEYTGIISLGATTPSFDLETPFDAQFPVDHITKEDLVKSREELTGTITQNVPVYSAVKVDGQRMYHMARKGETVRIKSREVQVHSFDIDEREFPDLRFRISVSKGTYIRAIADDFGRLVGSGGHLVDLRRTSIGQFSVDDAWSVNALVEAIQALEDIESQDD
jgi:tRNA pseudouridine55 synthase